jgi:hypothetical protein
MGGGEIPRPFLFFGRIMDFTENMFANKNMLWMVAYGNIRVVVWEIDREAAKRAAHRWIGADKDNYICTPLTQPSDRVKIDITLHV